MGRYPFSLLLVLLVTLVAISCKDENAIAEAVLDVEIDLRVDRFDRELAASTAGTLPELKAKFPYLFPDRYPDSLWLAKLTDTLQIALLDETDKAFGDFSEEKDQLELFFKHVKYYFPQVQVPKIVTVISEVDYANRIIVTDSLVLLGLDNYLGPEHRFYAGIDRYIAKGLQKEYLISDLGSAYSQKIVPNPKERTFLAQMVYYGKILYLKEQFSPWLTEAQLIRYSPEELEWAKANEEQIWRYFVSRELLYSTDRELGPRFLDPAPFSKFRLEIDNESPGRVGRFIGWQIVKSFAEQNDLSPAQLIAVPAARIFSESNYKPRK